MTNQEFVRLIQGKMKSLGLYQGATDGIAGPKTLAAFEAMISLKKKEVKVLLPRIDGDDIPDSGDAKLNEVNEDLQRVIRTASLRCEEPFTVIEGLRSLERQKKLLAAGASKTMNSRHLTGHAVDLWPLDENGKPLPSGTKSAEAKLWEKLRIIASVVKAVAQELRVEIEWGGDWGWDGPHFQLSRKAYP